MNKIQSRFISSLMRSNPTKQTVVKLMEFELTNGSILENGYIILNAQGLVVYDSRAAIKLSNKKFYVLGANNKTKKIEYCKFIKLRKWPKAYHISPKNVILSKYRPTTLKKCLIFEITKFSGASSIVKSLNDLQDFKLDVNLSVTLQKSLDELHRIKFKAHVNIKMMLSQIFDLKSTVVEYCPNGCDCSNSVTIIISQRLNDHRLGFLPAGLFTKKMYSSIKIMLKSNSLKTR